MDFTQRKLLALLESTFNPEGDIHFLAIAEKKIHVHEKERPVHQVRVALTFQEGDTVNPYCDGTDLFVTIGEDNIQFALEEDWADGPLAAAKAEGKVLPESKLPVERWSTRDKFSIVVETATLSEIELSEYCRAKELTSTPARPRGRVPRSLM